MATWYAGANSVDSGNNSGWIFTTPGSGITGTLAFTLDAISSTATGTVTHNGSIAISLDNVVIVSSGLLRHAGSLATTLDSITPQLSGVITHNGNASLTLNDIQFVASGTDVHSGPFALVLDDVSFVANGATLNSAKGGYPSKKRSYIINGKRLRLDQAGLEQQLANLVEEKIASPAKEIAITQDEAWTPTELIRIQPLGIEFSAILDRATRQHVEFAIKKIEAERLGSWIELQTRQREEEEFLMLLLAA